MDTAILDDILECAVCFRTLDENNKALPCQHTFCKPCLEAIVAVQKELRCPECRVVINKSIDELPPNVLLIRLLDGLKNQQKLLSNSTNRDLKEKATQKRHSVEGILSEPNNTGTSKSNGNSRNAGHERMHSNPEILMVPNLSSSKQPSAKAVYAYSSTHEGDLNLSKGDKIALTRWVDNNWLVGECNGRTGIFPANHVEIVVPLPDEKPFCRALYDFKSTDHEKDRDCLIFNKDDTIYVLRRVDQNWGEGVLNDEVGIFPLSFVKMNSAARKLIEEMSKPNTSATATAVKYPPSSSSSSGTGKSSEPSSSRGGGSFFGAAARRIANSRHGSSKEGKQRHSFPLFGFGASSSSSTSTATSTSTSVPPCTAASPAVSPAVPNTVTSGASPRAEMMTSSRSHNNNRHSMELDAGTNNNNNDDDNTENRQPQAGASDNNNTSPARQNHHPQPHNSSSSSSSAAASTVARRDNDQQHQSYNSAATPDHSGRKQHAKANSYEAPSQRVRTSIAGKQWLFTPPSHQQQKSKPDWSHYKQQQQQEVRISLSPSAAPSSSSSKPTAKQLSNEPSSPTHPPSSPGIMVTSSTWHHRPPHSPPTPLQVSAQQNTSSSSKQPSPPPRPPPITSTSTNNIRVPPPSYSMIPTTDHHHHHHYHPAHQQQRTVKTGEAVQRRNSRGRSVSPRPNIHQQPQQHFLNNNPHQHLQHHQNHRPYGDKSRSKSAQRRSTKDKKRDKSGGGSGGGNLLLKMVPGMGGRKSRNSSTSSSPYYELNLTHNATPSGDLSSSQPTCSQHHSQRSRRVRDRYYAVMSYPANGPDELDLHEGDVIVVHERRMDGWFCGTHLRSGKIGHFPATFVEPIPPEE